MMKGPPSEPHSSKIHALRPSKPAAEPKRLHEAIARVLLQWQSNPWLEQGKGRYLTASLAVDNTLAQQVITQLTLMFLQRGLEADIYAVHLDGPDERHAITLACRAPVQKNQAAVTEALAGDLKQFALPEVKNITRSR